jgi:putative MATE family efflux protein
VVVERFFQMLVGMADIAMVGRIGAAGIAGVGLSNQIAQVAMALYDAVRVGTTALVARRVGAREFDAAAQVTRQSLVLCLVLALPTVAAGFVLAAPGLRVLGAEADVVSMGTPYLRWKACSMAFAFFTMTCAAALRGAGDARTPMWAGVLVNIVNLVGNYAFIFGRLGAPALGVTGAGVATFIARGVGSVYILSRLLRGQTCLRVRFSDSFRPHRQTLRSLLDIGLPATGERGLMRSAQLIYTAIIARLGTDAYAAHQIALRAESLSFMPGFSFGAAATTLVGQHLGNGDPRSARLAANRARNLAVGVMSTMGVVFFLFARPLVAFFAPNSPAVVEQGAVVLRLVALAQPGMAIFMVLAGALRGAGDTRWVMYLTGTGVWGFRVVLTYLLVVRMGLGLPGAWWAMIIDQTMRGVLFSWRFRAGKWQEIQV